MSTLHFHNKRIFYSYFLMQETKFLYSPSISMFITFRYQRKSVPTGLTLVTLSKVALNRSPIFCRIHVRRRKVNLATK